MTTMNESISGMKAKQLGGRKSRATLTPEQRRAAARVAAPVRWGHAQGHLREAFIEWVEDGATAETVTVGVAAVVLPVDWLFGQLWNCSDTMPGALCDDLDQPRGSTYARAVRGLKRARRLEP